MTMSRRLDAIIRVALHNKGLKVLAILLASSTWYYIREATSYEEVLRDIPLEVLLPEGWAIEERSVNNVAVTFRGLQVDIRNLNKNQVRVQVDARNRPIDRNDPTILLPVQPRQVAAPRSVRAMYVNPPEVELTLDREAEKTVPVELVRLGEPPEGYFVERFSVTPEKVTLYGPERRLADVESVRTVPVDMAGRIRTFAIQNHPLTLPGENWQARMDFDRVTLNFTITERTVRQDYTNIPVKVMLPPGVSRNLVFFPPAVNVSLRGRSDVISNLPPSAIHAFVNAENVSAPDGEDLPVEMTTLPGVQIIMIDPPAVRVTASGQESAP